MLNRGTDGRQPPFRGRLVAAAAALLVTGGLLTGATAAVPPQHGLITPVAASTAQGTTSAAVAKQYELVSPTKSKRPLRWLACRAIAYRINTKGMPKGMDRVVKSTMGVIAKQTGVAFHYAGTTKRTFAATSRPSTPTIYFGFTGKKRAYGYSFGYPGEIGIGGPTGAWIVDGAGRYEAITSGRVLLSTAFPAKRTGSGATWQSLIVHEVGHALNLAHRSASREAMHPVLTDRAPGRFAPDELRALKRVLQRTGCDYGRWREL